MEGLPAECGWWRISDPNERTRAKRWNPKKTAPRSYWTIKNSNDRNTALPHPLALSVFRRGHSISADMTPWTSKACGAGDDGRTQMPTHEPGGRFMSDTERHVRGEQRQQQKQTIEARVRGRGAWLACSNHGKGRSPGREKREERQPRSKTHTGGTAIHRPDLFSAHNRVGCRSLPLVDRPKGTIQEEQYTEASEQHADRPIWAASPHRVGAYRVSDGSIPGDNEGFQPPAGLRQGRQYPGCGRLSWRGVAGTNGGQRPLARRMPGCSRMHRMFGRFLLVALKSRTKALRAPLWRRWGQGVDTIETVARQKQSRTKKGTPGERAVTGQKRVHQAGEQWPNKTRCCAYRLRMARAEAGPTVWDTAVTVDVAATAAHLLPTRQLSSRASVNAGVATTSTSLRSSAVGSDEEAYMQRREGWRVNSKIWN